MTHAVDKLIEHIQRHATELADTSLGAYYTESYKKLLNGKDDYINDHNEDIKFYTKLVERLQVELSQLELFKQQLIITTSIMYNGEMVYYIDNYIANIRLRMEHLSNTLLHKQTLDIEVDYERQLSLSEKMMDDYIAMVERQISFNNDYLLVKDSLLELKHKTFEG